MGLEQAKHTYDKNIVILNILMFSLFLFLYFPIFPDMFSLWINNSNNSHGILVPFISMYILWTKRADILTTDIKVCRFGLIILLVSLLSLIIGYMGGIEVLPRLTIVTTLVGLIIYNFGLRLFAKLSFPLLFLFFMVPIPVSVTGLISFPLQLLATKLSAQIISSMSIPVLREGNILFFANTSLEVAEACSGIRSLVAYIMLGFLFSYFMKVARWKHLIIILSAFPLAFLANLLRVTGTGILAHYFGGRVARGFLHEFSGLVMFGFGLVLMFMLYFFLCKQEIVNKE